MGDRCYFEVKCLEKDRKKFEKLGLCWQGTENGVATLTDEESNLDQEDLPMVPYKAWHGDGAEYDGARMACDGKKWNYAHVNKAGDIVVGFCEPLRQPFAVDVRHARIFLAIERRVEKIFKCAEASSAGIPSKRMSGNGRAGSLMHNYAIQLLTKDGYLKPEKKGGICRKRK